MLLVDPLIAAQSLDVSCGVGREAVSAMDALIAPLTRILPRVEQALNVRSLVQATFLDTFDAHGRGYDGQHNLRLSNGFIDPGTVVVTVAGEPLDATSYDLDAERGVVYLSALRYQGKVTVQHTGGFTARTTDSSGEAIPENRQVLEVPEWLQSIAILALNEWLRSAARAPTVKEGVSLRDLNLQSNRALQNAIWGYYMRPRAEMTWARSTIEVH